jgi:hypothetical protein
MLRPKATRSRLDDMAYQDMRQHRSCPIRTFVPKVIATGRSVLPRKVKHGTPR